MNRLPDPYTAVNGSPLKGWPWTEETDPAIYHTHEQWPKISIVTPSYNQADYLEQTIRSVLAQNYPNLEYILIDGGSTDQSVEIIKKYSPWINYWVSEPDSGQGEALEKGFKKISGEIAAWINSDDFYEKGAFYKVASLYRQHHFSFLCGTCEMIDQHGQPIRKLHTKKITYKSLIRYWEQHFCPPQPSIFFKRDILAGLGFFDTSLKYAMDYDLWLKASKKYSFYNIEDKISYYRVHTHSKTGSPGGLRKFVPEWKMLINRSLKQESLLTRLNYRFDENLFLISKRLRRLFNKI